MLAEFSIVPVGSSESLGDAIADVLRIVDESGVPYRAHAMGTVLEGEWDSVMDVIRKCHEEVIKTAPRLVSNISIDLRPSKPLDRMTEKLKSVEQRLGRTLR